MIRFSLAGVAAGAFLLSGAAVAQDDDAVRAARWNDLAQDIFGARQIQAGDAKISLEAPERQKTRPSSRSQSACKTPRRSKASLS
jgi:hypothetical protein